MSMWDDVTVIIRSAREHILTLDSHPLPKKANVVIVASREQYEHHKEVYTKKRVTVVRNPGKTLASSALCCYTAAKRAGRPYFFRMDDELPETFFVGMKEKVVDVEYVMHWFYRAIRALNLSMVGPASTSNRFWLQPKFIRSWAGISGAAVMYRTVEHPHKMIDASIRHFDDIYESCSHRWLRGAVGRVQFIGGDKKATTGPAQTTVEMLNKTQGHAVKTILERWAPDYITTDGWSFYTHNTPDDYWVTVNWIFKRHPGFKGGNIMVPEKEIR